jgi:hypothetical protein
MEKIKELECETSGGSIFYEKSDLNYKIKESDLKKLKMKNLFKHKENIGLFQENLNLFLQTGGLMTVYDKTPYLENENDNIFFFELISKINQPIMYFHNLRLKHIAVDIEKNYPNCKYFFIRNTEKMIDYDTAEILELSRKENIFIFLVTASCHYGQTYETSNLWVEFLNYPYVVAAQMETNFKK